MFCEGGRLRGEVNLADPGDLEIPTCVPTADEAVELLRVHHAGWQARGAE